MSLATGDATAASETRESASVRKSILDLEEIWRSGKNISRSNAHTKSNGSWLQFFSILL
jgi:hypothetical protein